MSTLADDLAETLAKDVIAHIDATGDEDVIKIITTALGERSQTLEEAFVTAVRVIRAERRAREILQNRPPAT